MASGLVFVTVGTTKFDSIISTLNQGDILAALHERGYSRLKLQIGQGDVLPNEGRHYHMDVSYYRFKDSIKQDIQEADLVISHAGAGSCLEVLEARKPLIVVINEDLMDNHQRELADQLSTDGHLYACTPSTLKHTILSIDVNKLKPIAGIQPNGFIEFLDSYMGFTR